MKHLTTVTDLNPEEIQTILDLSAEINQSPQQHTNDLTAKNILFCFEKPSLRTLVGTESALNQLGASVIHTTPEAFLGGNIVHAGNDLGARESLLDTVRNVEQFCDAIFVRVFHHATIEKLAALSRIPVINALCDQHHPCQALADMFTLVEHFANKKKLHVLFVGDGNNVAFSLGQILLLLGHHFSWAGPKDHQFNQQELKSLRQLESDYNGKLTLTHNPDQVIGDVDAVYTDTFVSMGEEDSYAQKISAFQEYRVDSELMKKAPEHAVFLHCLPAHREVEVSADVIDGPKSIVYRQARNRMTTARGLFHFLLKY